MKALKCILLPVHRKNHKKILAANCQENVSSKSKMSADVPEGARQSVLLDEQMIREIIDILPIRAYGYPWHLVYSSARHGFSLATLYRMMALRTKRVKSQYCPVLLLIREMDHRNVFGALINSDLQLDRRGYSGTGDSCLLFRFVHENGIKSLQCYKWTMRNDYFVYAQPDCLSIGGGDGRHGLWLDDSLNRGVSQRCATFGNEPLAGDDSEQSRIGAVELFCFGNL